MGRAIDANGDHSKILYFLQDTQCYKGSHSQTIREWLGSFDILREESIFIEYSSWLIDICKTLEEYGVFSNRSSESMKNSVYTALVHVMYLDYDWEKDFLSQFRANTQKLASIFEQAAILTALEQGGDTVVIAPQSESGV
ncbi:hypothetical protein AGMMS49975_26450 [Clostridia bacterium]|nr:hypothetical protein AGMMS49975_26450 [Clostridia bacterium]